MPGSAAFADCGCCRRLLAREICRRSRGTPSLGRIQIGERLAEDFTIGSESDVVDLFKLAAQAPPQECVLRWPSQPCVDHPIERGNLRSHRSSVTGEVEPSVGRAERLEVRVIRA